ncbi:MAG: FtsX-like permease family protein [Muribaculaceae bacterium]|nr:FtsX-like permease family protein [Muribaculaceae bacterium]
MKRALLSQIKHDWKENLWLVIELMIVSLVIWWLTLTLLRSYKDSQVPLGADMTDVYAAEITLLPSGEENNHASENTHEQISEQDERYVNALQAMLDRVKSLPMVEAAALGNNAMPYSYMNIDQGISTLQGKDTVTFYTNIRGMTPDGARVLRLQSLTDLTTDDLKKILEKGDILIGPSLEYEVNDSVKDFFKNHLVGKEVLYTGIKIGGLIHAVRRTDYETNILKGTTIRPIMEGSRALLELDNLLVRVKPGMGKEFMEAMQQEPALVSPTLIALNKLRSMERDKKLILWKDQVNNRTKIAGIIFLLVIIFIGLLGTFWYRVYLRTPEVAVRKTFGATDIDIFRRFLSEAFMILGIALGLSLIICLVSMDYLTNNLLQYVAYFKTWKWDMTLAGLITMAVMSLMIFIGVGIPARRAMKIETAVALKEE